MTNDELLLSCWEIMNAHFDGDNANTLQWFCTSGDLTTGYNPADMICDNQAEKLLTAIEAYVDDHMEAYDEEAYIDEQMAEK